MAYKSRTFACPECNGEFTVLLADTDPFPSYCALCNAYVGADPEPIPYFSRVGNAKHQTLDKVYRGMESASIARQEQAAADAGVPVSEMAMIRQTNMKDNLREGDTSFVMPTVAAPSAAQVAAVAGGQGAQMAAGLRKSAGADAGTGHRALDHLKGVGGTSHSQRARQMSKAGQLGSYAGK